MNVRLPLMVIVLSVIASPPYLTASAQSTPNVKALTVAFASTQNSNNTSPHPSHNLSSRYGQSDFYKECVKACNLKYYFQKYTRERLQVCFECCAENPGSNGLYVCPTPE